MNSPLELIDLLNESDFCWLNIPWPAISRTARRERNRHGAAHPSAHAGRTQPRRRARSTRRSPADRAPRAPSISRSPPTTARCAARSTLMLRSPAVGTAQQELGAAIRYRTGFTDRMRELAILLVAAHWDSAFERESHEAIARALGFGDDELAAIRAQDVTALRRRRAHRRHAPSSRCWTATSTTSCGMRHPPRSASTASSSSPRSSGTTRPSPCSCGCSVSA